MLRLKKRLGFVFVTRTRITPIFPHFETTCFYKRIHLFIFTILFSIMKSSTFFKSPSPALVSCWTCTHRKCFERENVRCVKVNLISCVCFEVWMYVFVKSSLVCVSVDCYPEICICKPYFELVDRIMSIMTDCDNHISEQAAAELTARLYSRKHEDWIHQHFLFGVDLINFFCTAVTFCKQYFYLKPNISK